MITNKPRNLDIGFATYGEDNTAPRETTLGLDPVANPDTHKPGMLQLAGIAENIPFKSNSLDRVTSKNTIGSHSTLDESLIEIVRVLKPGGTARIKGGAVDLTRKEIRDILESLPVTNIRVRAWNEFPDDPEGPLPTDFIITFTKTNRD